MRQLTSLDAQFLALESSHQTGHVAGLTILDPPNLEAELNQIAGVVTNGIFARRSADVLLLGAPDGVNVKWPPLTSTVKYPM